LAGFDSFLDRFLTFRRAVVALVLLCGLVYVNCLGGAFVWDDEYHFLDNPRILTQTVRSAFTSDLFASTEHPERFYNYRPLALLSYSWMARAFGLQPFALHLASVVLHALAGVLVFLLVLRFAEIRVAWFAAALFLVHPLHVEAVAWMTGFSEVLAGALMLASLYALVRAASGPCRGWLTAASGLAALLSFVTKETAFALPLLAVVFAGRRAWPLFVMAGMGLAARFAVLGANTAPLPPRTLWRHVSIAGLAGLQYVKKLLWPWPVAPEYEIWHPLAVWVGFAAVCALAGWAAYRYRHLRAGVLVVFLSLLPALASAPVLTTFWLARDRNAYIAVLGVALIAAYATRYRAGAAAATALVVLWSALSVAAIAHWRDTETLWTYTLQVTPNSRSAVLQLTTRYYLTGRFGEADRVLEHGLRYRPGDREYLRLRALARKAMGAGAAPASVPAAEASAP